MKIYLELYDDFKATVKFIEEKCGEKLNDQELEDTLRRMADAHQMTLDMGEIETFIQNWKDNNV